MGDLRSAGWLGQRPATARREPGQLRRTRPKFLGRCLVWRRQSPIDSKTRRNRSRQTCRLRGRQSAWLNLRSGGVSGHPCSPSTKIRSYRRALSTGFFQYSWENGGCKRKMDGSLEIGRLSAAGCILGGHSVRSVLRHDDQIHGIRDQQSGLNPPPPSYGSRLALSELASRCVSRNRPQQSWGRLDTARVPDSLRKVRSSLGL